MLSYVDESRCQVGRARTGSGQAHAEATGQLRVRCGRQRRVCFVSSVDPSEARVLHDAGDQRYHGAPVATVNVSDAHAVQGLRNNITDLVLRKIFLRRNAAEVLHDVESPHGAATRALASKLSKEARVSHHMVLFVLGCDLSKLCVCAW